MGELCTASNSQHGNMAAALRLFTDSHGETLWLETRSQYDAIKGHGMLHWVLEKPAMADWQVNGLENTQLLDWNSLTSESRANKDKNASLDSTIPPGAVYVYPLEDTNIVIQVGDSQEIQCGSVTLTAISVEVSYKSVEAGNTAIPVAAVACGEGAQVSPSGGKVDLFQVGLAHPQQFQVEVDCSRAQPEGSKLYVYDAYPMQLEYDDAHPEVGASAMVDIHDFCATQAPWACDAAKGCDPDCAAVDTWTCDASQGCDPDCAAVDTWGGCNIDQGCDPHCAAVDTWSCDASQGCDEACGTPRGDILDDDAQIEVLYGHASCAALLVEYPGQCGDAQFAGACLATCEDCSASSDSTINFSQYYALGGTDLDSCQKISDAGAGDPMASIIVQSCQGIQAAQDGCPNMCAVALGTKDCSAAYDPTISFSQYYNLDDGTALDSCQKISDAGAGDPMASIIVQSCQGIQAVQDGCPNMCAVALGTKDCAGSLDTTKNFKTGYNLDDGTFANSCQEISDAGIAMILTACQGLQDAIEGCPNMCAAALGTSDCAWASTALPTPCVDQQASGFVSDGGQPLGCEDATVASLCFSPLIAFNCPATCGKCPADSASLKAESLVSETGQVWKHFTGTAVVAVVKEQAQDSFDQLSLATTCVALDAATVTTCSEGSYASPQTAGGCAPCPDGWTSNYGSDSIDDCYQECDSLYLISDVAKYEGRYSLTKSDQPWYEGYPVYTSPSTGYLLRHDSRNKGAKWVLSTSLSNSAEDSCPSLARSPQATGVGDAVWDASTFSWKQSGTESHPGGPENCWLTAQPTQWQCACGGGE